MKEIRLKNKELKLLIDSLTDYINNFENNLPEEDVYDEMDIGIIRYFAKMDTLHMQMLDLLNKLKEHIGGKENEV